MNTGTGAWGFLLVVGTLVVGSTSASAESHPGRVVHPETKAGTLSASLAPHAQMTTPSAEPPRSEPLTKPSTFAQREGVKLRRLRKAEISPSMFGVAAQVMRQHYAEPVGTQIEVEVAGKRLFARIERHYHPEGGPVKPWGFHPGVSLFRER